MNTEKDLLDYGYEYFKRISLTVAISDTSDFNEEEKRPIPYIEDLENWNGKILNSKNSIIGDYCINKEKKILLCALEWHHG